MLSAPQAASGNSWTICDVCGVSMTAGSTSCWSCKANVTGDPGAETFSHWRRTPGVFATRMTVDAPRHRLCEGIQVEEGMRGMISCNGVKLELAAGFHPQASFWDKLVQGGNSTAPVEAVVAAAGPVSSGLHFSGAADLFTRDFVLVEATVRVKVELENLAAFVRCMLGGGSSQVRNDDLMHPYGARVAEVLRRHLSQLDVAEVARSTELRREVEAELGREVPRLMRDHGLRLCGVEDVRFDSAEISRVREAEGSLTKTRREQTWDQKKRELEKSHKLGEITDEFAFKAELDRLTQDYALTSMERESVVSMRRIQLSEAETLAATEAAARVRHLEKDHEIGLKRKDRDWEDEEDMRDLKTLDAVRSRQFEAMEKLQKLRQEKRDAETKSTIKLGQGLKDVPLPIAAGVLSPQQANQVLQALEMLRPLPGVTVEPSGDTQHTAAFGGQNFEKFARRHLSSVGVVVTGVEEGNPRGRGTAWVAAGRGVVITNAHVAEAIAGEKSWIIFSGQSMPLRVSQVHIHPEYALARARGHVVGSYDVAVLELESTPPQAGLPLASRSRLLALRELQPVAYLGFPMEGLLGNGTNLERPKAIAKKGVISSLEDWHMRHCDDPAQRQLIKHDLGATGGASGSPLFDETGEVIGIVFGGNVEMLEDSNDGFRRTPHAALINFAQRIDVLLDWMKW